MGEQDTSLFVFLERTKHQVMVIVPAATQAIAEEALEERKREDSRIRGMEFVLDHSAPIGSTPDPIVYIGDPFGIAHHDCDYRGWDIDDDEDAGLE